MKISRRFKYNCVFVIYFVCLLVLININLSSSKLPEETDKIFMEIEPAPKYEIMAEEVCVEEPIIELTPEPIIEDIPDPIEEYEEAAVYIAKTVYGEARGLTVTEQAAVIWCILNRVDQRESQTSEDIISVITKKKQFHGYGSDNPVEDDHYNLAIDVLRRWLKEKDGEIEVGRVLPKEYIYFAAYKGTNRFRDKYKGGNYWDWSLESPYEN